VGVGAGAPARKPVAEATSLLLQCSEVYSMHKEKRSHNKIK
jgi:hypothetical protein